MRNLKNSFLYPGPNSPTDRIINKIMGHPIIRSNYIEISMWEDELFIIMFDISSTVIYSDSIQLDNIPITYFEERNKNA